MKVTTKGQVTIPQAVREQLGIYAGTEVEFKVEGDRLTVSIEKPTDPAPDFTYSLRGKATVKMTTDEIMALTRADL